MEGDGSYVEWDAVVKAVKDAGDQLGWPVFIRSDLASAKHGGPECYLAQSADDVSRVLSRTAEDSEMKFWTERAGPKAFVVRKFLKLNAMFTAFHAFPVAREFRFFATPAEVLCTHPYWPEETIKFSRDAPEPEGWRIALALLHEQPCEDAWTRLHGMAIMAAGLCDIAPAWSVDFAQDEAGAWWLIDTAIMQKSWHWPDCPNARG
jgi:hypothetical protein